MNPRVSSAVLGAIVTYIATFVLTALLDKAAGHQVHDMYPLPIILAVLVGVAILLPGDKNDSA